MVQSNRSDPSPDEPGDAGARTLREHVSEVLREPAFKAGLERGRQIELVRRALREVCGEYAAGCRPVLLREGRLRLEVPNSTALQFIDLNRRAILARADRLGLPDPIREIKLAINPASSPGRGTHGH